MNSNGSTKAAKKIEFPVSTGLVITTGDKQGWSLKRVTAGFPWLTILSIMTALTLWDTIGRLGLFRAVPAVSKVWDAWLELYSGDLLSVLGTSATTFLWGFSAALAAAVVVSILTSMSKSIDYLLRPYIDAGMSIPITATVPILMMAFGINDTTRIAVVFLFAFFTMVISFQAGLEKVDPRHLDMAHALNSSKTQILLKVVLPSALPLAMTGIRLGVSRAIHGLITAEVILATAGIGWLLIRASREFNIPGIYAVTGTIIVITVVLMGSVSVLERRIHRVHS